MVEFKQSFQGRCGIVAKRFPEVNPELMIDGVDCCVIVIDPDMRLKYMNAAAEALANPKKPSVKQETTCHGRLFGLGKPCPGCPAAGALSSGHAVAGEIAFGNRVFKVNAIPDTESGLLVCCNRETTETAALLARLREGDRQYSRVINGIPMGVMIGEIISDRKGKPVDYVITHVNPAFEDHTGVPGDRVLNRRITGIFPGMSNLGIDLFANVVITGEPVERFGFSTVIQRYMNFFVFCLEPGKFACILNDLTRKKAVEERLRLVESAVEASTDEIYFLNDDGYFIYGNASVAENLGINRNELKNTHISGLNPSATREWWSDFMEQLKIRGHFQIESFHRRADGSLHPVELSSTLVENHRSLIVSTIARDSTVQTEELTALSRNRNSLENALSTASLAFWTYLPGSGKFSSDGRWAALTDQGTLPLSGDGEQQLFSAIHRCDRRRLRVELTSSPYESGTSICRLAFEDDSRWVRIKWRRSSDKDGLKVTAVCEDISSEKLLGLAGSGSDSTAMDVLLAYARETHSRLKHALGACEDGDLEAAHRLLSDMASDMEFITADGEICENVVYLEGFLREIASTVGGLLGPESVFSVDVPSVAAVRCDPELLERFFLRLGGFAGHSMPEGTSMRVWVLSGGGACGLMRITIDLDCPRRITGISSGHPALLEAYAAIRAMRGKVFGEKTENGLRITVTLPSAVLEPSGRVVVATDDAVEGRTVATVLRQMSLSVVDCRSGTEAMENLKPGDALIISSRLKDFPSDMPVRTLVLGSGYQGPAANLARSWTITSLRAAIRRMLLR